MNNCRIWLLCSIVSAHSLASIILVGYWMSHYHDGYRWRKGDFKKFNFHPLFMTIGFIGLAPHGALVYRLLPSVRNIFVKITHFLFQLCSLLFAAVGLTAVIQFHNEHGFAHFYSVHSWCGLVICILFSLQLVIGFVSFLFPRLPDSLRARVLKWHTFFGRAILLLAILTTITGVLRKTDMFGIPNYLNGERKLVNCLTLVLMSLFTLMLFVLKPKSNSGSYENIY